MKTSYMGIIPSQYNSQNEMPKLANEFKTKSHIGCCQMCIKMVKMSAKTWKMKEGTSMVTHQSSKRKNGGWKRRSATGHGKRPKSRGQINFATTIYKNDTIGCKITKKCHYWASNVGPFT